MTGPVTGEIGTTNGYATTAPGSAVPGGARNFGSVRRVGLLRRLAVIADGTPMIMLVGPAGYGKTTLLRQWAQVDGRAFGWLNLREPDNDPVLFRQRVEGVLRHRAPAGRAAPWVLVLDDAHLLHHHRCLEFVARAADTAPPDCTFVVAGRSRLVLDRGRGHEGIRCAELGPEDLSLTTGEVANLTAGLGLDLSPAAVTILRGRTEGWPAGTYLAALSIAQAPDADADAAAFAVRGDDAFIADYLRDEVLEREPADLVRFLLRTAPLEWMTPPLCDFVTGQSGSAAWLERLEHRNLLVADTDGRCRYRRLLAGMLRSELRRREPGEEERVHRRAAAWYGAHNRPEEAVPHALAAGDADSTCRLIGRATGRLMNEGHITLPQRWLTQLGTAALRSHPLLAVSAGWVWAIGGHAARARQCLLAAEAGVSATGTGAAGDSATGRRLTAGVAVLRAALAPQGVDAMLRDARRAVAAQPPGGPLPAVAAALLGVALVLTGRLDAGAAALTAAVRLGGPREAQFAYAQLSLLAAQHDDWTAAATYAAEARAAARRSRLPGYAFGAPAQVAEAVVALRNDDREAARRHANRALRLYAEPSLTAFPWLGAQIAIDLGRVQCALDDFAAAERRTAEARRHLARLATTGILLDRYHALAATLGSPDAPVLTAAETRVLGLLPTNLTLGQIADKLYLSRNTVKAHVAAVYRKLNASTRAQAVGTGRALGLLGC